MRQELTNSIEIVKGVTAYLKSLFNVRDEIIDLLVISAVTQENLLIVGPPGTAKSELVRKFASLLSMTCFSYMLSRFTEPEEIFGQVDLNAIKRGTYQWFTKDMLPNAEIVFLDEVFRGSSAILNSLLSISRERSFFTGDQLKQVPLLSIIGVANEIPDDLELIPLLDQFALRVLAEPAKERKPNELLHIGWQLTAESDNKHDKLAVKLGDKTGSDALRILNHALNEVSLDNIVDEYRELVRQIHRMKIGFGHKRIMKLRKLVSASSLLRSSMEASTEDFWVFRHVWSNPNQIPQLEQIVKIYIT